MIITEKALDKVISEVINETFNSAAIDYKRIDDVPNGQHTSMPSDDKREDRYKHLDYAIDNIDPEIEKLYVEKRMYEEYIEKELIRLGKYNEIEQLVVFYKEQTTTNYTWLEISQKVHYSVTQCRRIYRKWKNQRDID